MISFIISGCAGLRCSAALPDWSVNTVSWLWRVSDVCYPVSDSGGGQVLDGGHLPSTDWLYWLLLLLKSPYCAINCTYSQLSWLLFWENLLVHAQANAEWRAYVTARSRQNNNPVLRRFTTAARWQHVLPFLEYRGSNRVSFAPAPPPTPNSLGRTTNVNSTAVKARATCCDVDKTILRWDTPTVRPRHRGQKDDPDKRLKEEAGEAGGERGDTLSC